EHRRHPRNRRRPPPARRGHLALPQARRGRRAPWQPGRRPARRCRRHPPHPWLRRPRLPPQRSRTRSGPRV
ncbi:MAG: hypothetical protein AVDCRST_MAG44-118, partial [uncultured Sphingomonas sp.]